MQVVMTTVHRASVAGIPARAVRLGDMRQERVDEQYRSRSHALTRRAIDQEERSVLFDLVHQCLTNTTLHRCVLQALYFCEPRLRVFSLHCCPQSMFMKSVHIKLCVFTRTGRHHGTPFVVDVKH